MFTSLGWMKAIPSVSCPHPLETKGPGGSGSGGLVLQTRWAPTWHHALSPSRRDTTLTVGTAMLRGHLGTLARAPKSPRTHAAPWHVSPTIRNRKPPFGRLCCCSEELPNFHRVLRLHIPGPLGKDHHLHVQSNPIRTPIPQASAPNHGFVASYFK